MEEYRVTIVTSLHAKNAEEAMREVKRKINKEFEANVTVENMKWLEENERK